MDPKALHKIGYGMYLVASKKGRKINGQTANTVFQITSEPPTIGVSINKNNLTYEYITASRVFAVSVLCQSTPLSFIGKFGFHSGRETNKFDWVEYRLGVTGAPVITEHAVAFVEARVIKQVSLNTHTLFIGKVIDAGIIRDDICMTYEYYHEIKRGTTPKAAPSYIATE